MEGVVLEPCAAKDRIELLRPDWAEIVGGVEGGVLVPGAVKEPEPGAAKDRAEAETWSAGMSAGKGEG